MAITKLPRGGFADSAVTTSKVTDGVIDTAEIPDSEITSAKLADDAVTNAKLANSAITIRGTSVSLGGSHTANIDVDWQTVKTGNTTMVAGQGYFVNTTSSAITMTLPASASRGDTIAIKDYAGTFASNNCTIGRNGHNIQGNAVDSSLETNRATVALVYADSTKGWLFTQESNVGDLQGPLHTEATGGTVTTSGDFKIHTFTGDGNFVVSQLGNAPKGGPSNVDYLVVAGGAGGGNGGTGGGGGGGAGGYRTSFPSPNSNAGAFPISAQTYPITVGAGSDAGSPGPGVAPNGSNSVFSTITSAGGGGGGGGNNCGTVKGANGGSGGGSSAQTPSSPVPMDGGSGNTPPVSPPQGNDGGDGNWGGNFPIAASGGGGGIGGAGGNASTGSGAPTGQPSSAVGGNGGNGSANSITGSSVTYAGGGGGGTKSPYPQGGRGGSGGPGGGGNGNQSQANTPYSGTANTGGGGGGDSAFGNGGPGGSGIVIIRYKYQN